MRPETKAFLYDITTACEFLGQFSAGKVYADYASDPLLRSAIERQLIIVGEALFQALKIEPDLSDRISDTRRIVNFRHVMVHGYAVIQHETVWGVLQNHIATLQREVTQLLEE